VSVAERLFGLETEYAFLTRGRAGQPLDRRHGLELFMAIARERLPNLPALHSSGIFLQNGSRLYVDRGLHPELATPECANPWDAVRYVLAGEQMLADVAAEVAARDPNVAEALLFKCNVDYSGARSTWGCHESYLHDADPRMLPAQIIPHLVTRTIYTGAGGWDPLSAGLRFTLSPRSAFIGREVSEASTDERGIYHLKDEPLSGQGHHRLHVLCGESVCSQTASWLRVGTTALVVALAEAGKRPAEGLSLSRPTSALYVIASDATCRRRVAASGWRSTTAVAVQRRYLEAAEQHVDAPFMPPWAGEVCSRWRAVLDRLADAPDSAAGCLDWAIKRRLYAGRLERAGVPWDTLPLWTSVVEQLNDALARQELRLDRVPVDVLIGQASPIPDTVRRLGPVLRDSGLDWDGLRPFLQARQEMLEADIRFGQLGGGGIFSALDAHEGLLDHRVPGVDNIPHAVANPPAIGRARLRGECVRRFAAERAAYACEWHAIWDRSGDRVLDLADPFAAEERWRDVSGEAGDLDPALAPGGIMDLLRSMRQGRA